MKFVNRKTLATTLSLTGCLLAGLPAAGQISLEPIGGYGAGIFDGSAAEIPAYDAASQRLFVTNAADGTLDVIDLSDPTLPSLITRVNLGGGGPNSVAVSNGLVAVAVEASTVTDPGFVKFYNAADLTAAAADVTVGALPDMLTFTPDGSRLLVANEGEPDGVDPLGSVSIIDTGSFSVLNTADFSAFTDANTTTTATLGVTPTTGVRRDPGVATLAQDVEPEYIAVSADGSKAFVALQEANSVGVLDLTTNSFTSIQALGTIDHSLPGNGLDSSDRDDAVNITTRPVNGMFMPDAIAAYSAGGVGYYVTANEGDDRGEDERIKDLTLDPTAFPDAAALQENEVLGRLGASTWDGDTDGDGDFDQLFTYGTRSFSIFDEAGNLVFNSGDDFEQITANTAGVVFNATNDENDSFDNRSDNKGPEPEGVTLGQIDGRTYAFIGLERVGGVMIYDITDPLTSSFVDYLNLRDFTIPDQDADEDDGDLDDNGFEDADDGVRELNEAVTLANGLLMDDLGELDLGPEGLLFISAADSPNGNALLVVTNEVSGTTTVFNVIPEPGTGLALLALTAVGLRRRRTA
jgi:DNA-binding beta-propeller fold protein YncE